jgi:hypothetical protein
MPWLTLFGLDDHRKKSVTPSAPKFTSEQVAYADSLIQTLTLIAQLKRSHLALVGLLAENLLNARAQEDEGA